MTNNKQSSVEWLIEQLKEYDFSEEDDNYVIKIQSWVLTEKQEQAKAMHNKEMKEMYLKGIENYDPTFKIKDNETFGCSDSLNESRNFGNETQDVFQGD